MAPRSDAAGTRSRVNRHRQAPLTASTASASGRLLVPARRSPPDQQASAFVSARIGGISATRVKTRRLWASTTRGRSALLVAAMTTTDEKAPGMAAKRAVVRSQPWTRSR